MATRTSTPKKDHHWPLTLLLCMLIVTTGFGVVTKLLLPKLVKADTIGVVSDQIPITTVSTKLSQTTIDTMNTAINEIIAKYPSIETGVTVTNLKSGETFNYGETTAYYAASVGKLITATLYLHNVDIGTRSLSTIIGGETAQYQLQQMIEQSDNTAWKLLDDNLGKDNLQAWADENGLSGYDASENNMTSADAATLLTKLYSGTLISASSKDMLLTYMKNANKTEYIVAAVPSTMTVYHKAGWLDDRILDTAIIDNGKQSIVISIFTKTDGTYDTEAGQQLFHELTNAITTSLLAS